MGTPDRIEPIESRTSGQSAWRGVLANSGSKGYSLKAKGVTQPLTFPSTSQLNEDSLYLTFVGKEVEVWGQEFDGVIEVDGIRLYGMYQSKIYPVTMHSDGSAEWRGILRKSSTGFYSLEVDGVQQTMNTMTTSSIFDTDFDYLVDQQVSVIGTEQEGIISAIMISFADS